LFFTRQQYINSVGAMISYLIVLGDTVPPVLGTFDANQCSCDAYCSVVLGAFSRRAVAVHSRLLICDIVVYNQPRRSTTMMHEQSGAR
jgi:hypothetical protein